VLGKDKKKKKRKKGLKPEVRHGWGLRIQALRFTHMKEIHKQSRRTPDERGYNATGYSRRLRFGFSVIWPVVRILMGGLVSISTRRH
jgi:hypothetical protein